MAREEEERAKELQKLARLQVKLHSFPDSPETAETAPFSPHSGSEGSGHCSHQKELGGHTPASVSRLLQIPITVRSYVLCFSISTSCFQVFLFVFYSSKNGVQWEGIEVASLVPKPLGGWTWDETKKLPSLCLCLSSRGPALGHSASTQSFAGSATLMKRSHHVLKYELHKWVFMEPNQTHPCPSPLPPPPGLHPSLSYSRCILWTTVPPPCTCTAPGLWRSWTLLFTAHSQSPRSTFTALNLTRLLLGCRNWPTATLIPR